MLFTRTIRRKMVCGMTLVLVMLVMLSLSGISGLMSYRNAINDLDFSINRAPRRADLSDAIGMLFDPLLFENVPNTVEGARYQQAAFQKRLAEAQVRVSEFRRRLDNLPPSETAVRQRPVTLAMLDQVDRRLDNLRVLQEQLTTNVPRRAQISLQMLTEVGRLESLAQRIPDYEDGLNNTLTKARGIYRSRFVMVCLASAIVVLLFLGLVRYGYLWIFAPLRKLHQGASRVALGDFGYRLELNSHDEMAELAESFNKMTERFQATTHDLDRKVRERSKQLVRSERLAGIGFLAAGVAHEINNPLQAIGIAGESVQNRMYELLADAPEEERQVVDSYLNLIQSEADRCQQITRKLLDFARGQDNTRSRFDLTEIIREVMSMVQHMSKFQGRKIEFSPERPCYAEVNGPEIKQVVLNLVANSLESMDERGTLRIVLREEMDQVILQFTDDGCGMSSDTIENLFEPFFTQRRDGKGTGLGMSISQRIIGDHGGTIEASSEGPGRGSTFLVHLPRRVAQELPAAA